MQTAATRFPLVFGLLMLLSAAAFAAPEEAPQTETQRPSARRGRGGPRGGGGGDGGLVTGQMAPEVKLKSVEGEDETSLQSLRAEKPVILFFGSYS